MVIFIIMKSSENVTYSQISISYNFYQFATKIYMIFKITGGRQNCTGYADDKPLNISYDVIEQWLLVILCMSDIFTLSHK